MNKPTRAQAVVGVLLWIATLTFVYAVGCQKNAPLHPNAINAFDSNAADDLLLVQTTLCGPNSTTTSCPGGLTAESKTHPSLVSFVQTATKSYNTAVVLYQGWVKAVTASQATAAIVPANVQNAINQAKTDTASAQRQLTSGGTQ